ncbi:MAG: YjgP/YjgQ family permease [Parvularculaceae bacterium]|jgi:lipopolysaccharide export system permease protein|nr:YjgP/YjgQ family permease [Parvularculaceae bacterium]
MGLIDRYILRAVLTPLLLALGIAGMLLLLEQMLRLFDFVLAEQGPVDVVWRMLANLVPHYLGLALPLGAFIGIMLAFRNLSLSSELDALNSSGASIPRLLRPVYGLVILLMIFDFLLVSYIQPYARYKYERIRFDVTSGALGIKIPQGEFVDIGERVTIRLGKVNAETKEAGNIFLEQRDGKGGKTVITALSAGISTTPDVTRLILNMKDGRQIIIDDRGDRASELSFETFDVEVDLPAIAVFRNRGTDDREATFDEIWRFLRTNDRSVGLAWHDYHAGFHWRLIHPLTFLVMPILAVAMGVTGRRRQSNLKPIVGIAILIVYHELLEEWGKVVASEGVLSPYISMWGLFAAFTTLCFVLYRGSVDKARTARIGNTGVDDSPVRVLADGAVDDGSAAGAVQGAVR